LKQPVSSKGLNTPEAALTAADLRGILLPLPTPFDSGGELDLRGLSSNIAKWNRTGIIGHVILGSTGERVHLDEREYRAVIELARLAVPQELTFIVGAGQQSTLGTINEIKRAAAVAIDAVLVITPHFYRSAINQQALVDHYTAVADNSRVPVILYSMPALTGVKILPETAARLSEHENIIGIKDSSTDIEEFRETVRLVQRDFAVLTGNGTVLCEGLRAGARGGILAVGCVAPALCLAIFDALKSGKINRAAMLQTRLSPLAEAVTVRFGIGGLKAALDMKGYVGGAVRAPLRTPDKEARAEIQRCLDEAEKALPEYSAPRLGASH
jgi:4-hydroxy-tetrahydrodipicolinate synthase